MPKTYDAWKPWKTCHAGPQISKRHPPHRQNPSPRHNTARSPSPPASRVSRSPQPPRPGAPNPAPPSATHRHLLPPRQLHQLLRHLSQLPRAGRHVSKVLPEVESHTVHHLRSVARGVVWCGMVWCSGGCGMRARVMVDQAVLVWWHRPGAAETQEGEVCKFQTGLS